MDGVSRFTATNLGPTLQAKGLKQSWLAAKLGVSKSMMSKVTAGERTLDQESAELIASLVGVPLFLLFELRVRSETVSVAEALPA